MSHLIKIYAVFANSAFFVSGSERVKVHTVQAVGYF